MAEKDSVIKEKVKYSGYGDFKSLYSYAYDWLKQENYTIVEELYNEKVKGNPKDLELMWRASRDITDYFRVELELKWRILGMEDVEVEV